MTPRLRVSGKYNIDAKVTFIPIVGDGTFWFTTDDVVITGFLVPTNNADGSLKGVELVDLDFTNGNIKMRFNNLFESDQILGETINSILNENASELMESMSPVGTEIFDTVRGGNDELLKPEPTLE